MATELVDVPRFFDPDDKPLDGTPFGSGAAMTSTIPRQRDRRRPSPTCSAALTRALDRRHDISLMRGVFEQTLRQVVPVRTVQLREPGSRWGQRPDAAAESGVRGVRGAWRRPAGIGPARGDVRSRTAASANGIFRCSAWRRTWARSSSKSSAPGCSSRAPGCAAAPRVAARRRGAADWIDPGHADAAVDDRARRRHRFHRVAGRRIRRRQGARRPSDPRVEPPPERPVRRRQLRRARRDAARGGTVRHRGSRPPPASAAGAASSRLPTGGTLFLDEVSDLSLSAQAKLLRADPGSRDRAGRRAQHAPLDIRIVAATNRGLADLVERRLFRPDLFYRLSGVDVRVPTLRERRADILELAEYFLERHRGTRPLRLSAARGRRARHLRLAGQRARARAADGARGGAGRIRGHRARRPAADGPRRLCRGARALAAAPRHAARVGEPVRAAGSRALPGQQAGSVPRAGHQLPHAAGVSALPLVGGGRRRPLAVPAVVEQSMV